MTSKLFSPAAIGPIDLRNRIVVPPMCQYSATNGHAADWHLIHYGTLALSGAGLVIVEATAVVPEGRITPYCLGLWDDDCAKALGRILSAIRVYSDAPFCLQLGHAGAKASTDKPWINDGAPVASAVGGWTPVSPSGLAYDEMSPTPDALDAGGVKNVISAFARAAERAFDIGFDAVEIHAAHGYLLHQFLSPLTNKRDDEYGGSLENRMRLTLETFDAIKKIAPDDKAVGVRLSGSDWVEGGWTIEDSVKLVASLKERGCAYAHVSSGGLSPDQKIPVGPGYQLELARRVRAETDLATIAVGLITEPAQAETIVNSGQADMVAIGRGMLFDPRWPWRAALALGAQQVPAPPQALRAAPYGAPEDFFAPLSPKRV